MKMRIRHVIIAVALIMSATVRAQFYITGDDPLSPRLWQTKTKHTRIIHDKDAEKTASHLASIIDSIAELDCMTMLHTPKPIDIVFHSHSIYANGMSSWAPSRIEMYTNGDSDGDCIPWMTHLAIHEYRHTVQTSMLNCGFTRALNIIFGEQATGAVLGVYVPLWLMEGDAVVSETALTKGGRGRKAAFLQEMRALALSDMTPKYDCAYNGSYRQRWPNYYHMGYLTVSNARVKYGEHVWRNALRTVGRKSFSFTPFNRSLRNDTGKRKVQLYNEAMRDWKTRWQLQDSSIVPTPYDIIASATGDYSEYTSVRKTDKGLIAYKTDPDETGRIIFVKDDKTLIDAPVRTENDIASNGTLIAWCEMHQHPRWNNASESPLYISDLKGNKKRLLRHGRFSAPSFSADGTHIAAVEIMDDGTHTIVRIDLNGEIEHRTQLPEGIEAAYTAWIGDDIAFIALTNSGKAILTESGKQLTPYRFRNIRHLTTDGKNLYFTSDETGIDNIYVMTPDGTESRITSARFGAAWPCIDGTTLYYSDYSAKGYAVAQTNIATRATDTPIRPDVADILSAQEDSHRDTTFTADVPTSKRYRRIAHLFRIHSWGPVVVDADNQSADAGFAISSQNSLGNSIASAAINLNGNTEDRYTISYSYTALFPKITLSAAMGYHDYKLDGYTINPDNELLGTRYFYDDRQRMRNCKATMSIPLSFTSGAWISSITTSASIAHYRNSPIQVTKQPIRKIGNRWALSKNTTTFDFNDANYTNARYSIMTHIRRRTSSRDVGTRAGVSLEYIFRHSIGHDDFGNMHYASASIYLPGIGKHHNISASIQAQKKNAGEISQTLAGINYRRIMTDISSIARGTSRIANTQMMLIRTNYTLPLVNPDWSIGPVVFVKRICLRLFYDHERLRPYLIDAEDSQLKNISISSTGAEIWAESYWLRLPYAVKLGYRGSKVIDGGFRSELIFNVNINR